MGGRDLLFGGDGRIGDDSEGRWVGRSGRWRESLTSGRKGNAEEKPSLPSREAGETERHEHKDQECCQLGHDQGRREGREEAAFKQEFGHKTSCVGGRRRGRQSMVAPPSMLNVRARRCPRENALFGDASAREQCKEAGRRTRAIALLEKLRADGARD